MDDKKLGILFGLILGLMLIQFVSAEIMISQINSTYSRGENLEVLFEVDNFQEDYFDVELICANTLTIENVVVQTDQIGNETNVTNQTNQNVSTTQTTSTTLSGISLYHGILSEKAIQLNRQLTPVYIGNSSGDCYIKATYGSDVQTSESFYISDKLDVDLTLNELIYSAGETVQVSGKAVRENGKPAGVGVSAYVEIKMGNQSKINSPITNGNFSVNFSTDSNMQAGNYVLEVLVVEKINGEILNSGEDRIDLTITQKPSWMAIAVDKQIVYPEQEIKIVPILYDNSNMEINGQDLLFKILDVNGKSLFEKIVLSGENLSYVLKSDHAPGYSLIIAEKDGIRAEKVFDVKEAGKINVQVINNSLIITNVGNIDYHKAIEVDIGGEIIIQQIDLLLGETKTYALNAPTGDYNLQIRDESGSLGAGSVSLTGNAISIREAGDKIGNVFTRYPVVWLFILIIIGLVIFVMYKNNKKKKFYGFSDVEKKIVHRDMQNQEKAGFMKRALIKLKPKHEESQENLRKEEPVTKLESMTQKPSNIIRPGKVTQGEQVLVVNGEKHNAGIIVLKIKNQLGSIGKETLKHAFNSVYENKGVIAQVDSSFAIVFSPVVTRTSRNTSIAIKTAMTIMSELENHNKKFKEKIEYGMGINEGEIIAKIEQNKLKFATVGQTINLAKRIATIAKNKFLISQQAHDKTRHDIKIDKAEESQDGLTLYKIKRIIQNDEKNKEFINNFLNRSKKER